MKKTVMKRRKRIVPANDQGSTPPRHGSQEGVVEGPASTSSNSPSPPLPPNTNHPHSHSPPTSYGPLPPPWATQQSLTSNRTSYSPEPQDFTNYRPQYIPSATFPSSYTEENTLPPIRFPVGQHSQNIISHQAPSIQHVGGAIPLPKRKMEDLDPINKRLRSIGPLLHP